MPWFLTGWLGFILSGIILSFYSVVGGWILSYLIRAIGFKLSNNDENFFAELFGNLTLNAWEVVLAQGAFLFIVILIISSGIQNGVEKASKWMMPLLFVFFIILAIRSMTLDGAMDGIKFMFVPDWSYLTGKTLLLALGQAFFSLSVGVAAMLTYASYLKKMCVLVHLL